MGSAKVLEIDLEHQGRDDLNQLYLQKQWDRIKKKAILAYAYGNTGIFSTVLDEVYVTVGQGDTYKKINLLSGKNIKEFVSGNPCNCYAFSKFEIYSWGNDNAKGQLGLGNNIMSVEPAMAGRIGGSLVGKEIHQLVGASMSSNILLEYKDFAPSLGLAWRNLVNNRIVVSKKKDGKRWLEVPFSSYIPVRSMYFELDAEGVSSSHSDIFT